MVLKNFEEMIKNTFRPSVTRLYPEVPTEVSDRYRGMHKLDRDKCIGCGICASVCPTRAIRIDQVTSIGWKVLLPLAMVNLVWSVMLGLVWPW